MQPFSITAITVLGCGINACSDAHRYLSFIYIDGFSSFSQAAALDCNHPCPIERKSFEIEVDTIESNSRPKGKRPRGERLH